MGIWQLDPYHTQVEFSAKHLGMMTVRGYFDEISAAAAAKSAAGSLTFSPPATLR